MRGIAPCLAGALAIAAGWPHASATEQPERQPPQEEVSEYGYVVDPADRNMQAAEGANVRAGPGPGYPILEVVDTGDNVRVTGDVRGRKWVRVAVLRVSTGSAFIYAPLLKQVETAVSGEADLEHGSAPVPANKPQPVPIAGTVANLSGPNWSVTEDQACHVWVGGQGERQGPITWSGACIDGMASGEGRLTHGSGQIIYEGSMRAGKRHGHGALTSPDGDRYEGEFLDGLFHGYGIKTWSGGSRYEGEFRQGRPNGYGIATYVSGSRYEGRWREGCFDGQDGRRTALMTDLARCGFE